LTSISSNKIIAATSGVALAGAVANKIIIAARIFETSSKSYYIVRKSATRTEAGICPKKVIIRATGVEESSFFTNIVIIGTSGVALAGLATKEIIVRP
jgi:hypothetical protein